MADAELKIKAVFESDKSSAQKAGEDDAKAYADANKKLRSKEAVRQEQEENRKMVSRMGNGGRAAGNKFGKEFSDAIDKTTNVQKLKFMRLTESMVKNYSMLSGVVLNPMGGLTTMFASRQVFQARRDKAAQERLMGGAGEGIAGSILKTGMLVAGATAVGGALAVLKKSIEEASKALSIWGKSASSGFGVGFNIRRQVTEKVMGVSEADSIRFMGGLGLFGPQLKKAMDVLEESNPVTARLGAEWESLKIKLEALVSELAKQIGPGLIDAFNEIGKSIVWLISQLQKAGNAISFAAAYWGARSSGASSEEALKIASGQNGSRYEGYKMPAAISFMKQLPASAWEKMGLVVGGGGGVNYAAQTAKNTADLVKLMKQQVHPQGQMRIQVTPSLA